MVRNIPEKDEDEIMTRWNSYIFELRTYLRYVRYSVVELSAETFDQNYRAQCGNAMLVSLGGAQTWRPEINESIPLLNYSEYLFLA